MTVACCIVVGWQLIEHNNTPLLKPSSMYETESTILRGFELSPHYASGIMYTSSILDMMLCQVGHGPGEAVFDR